MTRGPADEQAARLTETAEKARDVQADEHALTPREMLVELVMRVRKSGAGDDETVEAWVVGELETTYAPTIEAYGLDRDTVLAQVMAEATR